MGFVIWGVVEGTGPLVTELMKPRAALSLCLKLRDTRSYLLMSKSLLQMTSLDFWIDFVRYWEEALPLRLLPKKSEHERTNNCVSLSRQPVFPSYLDLV